MKKLSILFILALSVNCAFADNFYQNTNPFPQTSIQTLNNIYEAEPSVIQEQQQKKKKFWLRKGKNLEEQDRQEAIQKLNKYPNEGTINSSGDSSFYKFK